MRMSLSSCLVFFSCPFYPRRVLQVGLYVCRLVGGLPCRAEVGAGCVAGWMD
jgi:hypothetical protein